MKKSVTLLMFLALIIYGNVFAADSFVGYKDTEIAVKLSESTYKQLDFTQLEEGRTGLKAIDQLNAEYGISRIYPHFTQSASSQPNDSKRALRLWYKIRFPAGVNVSAMAVEYEELNEILVADPIPIHKAYKSPDDPDYSEQWHLNQSNDADIDAPEGWDVGTGSEEVVVAVMDTGVEWWHVDLAGTQANQNDRTTIGGNMWINEDELSNTDTLVDEDGNGYNDDWVGWDFVTGNPQSFDVGDDYDVQDNNPSDHHGHGTHCAGNVGAVNNNSTGVNSASGGWGEDANGKGNGVKIMALRIGWDDFLGGYVNMDFAAQAFEYAEINDAEMASCSWGSSEYGPLVDALNTFLYGSADPAPEDPKLRLVFKAAGNNGDESTDYMTGRDDIIAVAATQSDDNAATGFTSYGTWVDISAPGDNIYSTHNNGGYTSISGTSMSTPIAASVAAGIWSLDLNLSADEVETYLYDGADNIDDHLDSKYIGKMGAGRVNLYNSLQLVPTGSNSAPLAQDDNAATDEDTSVEIDVLSNDSDPDSDDLTISAIITQPANGSVSDQDTIVVYTPDADFNGNDQFEYEVHDGNGGRDTARVDVTVNAVNDAPVAVDDAAATKEDSTITIDVLANDSDTEDDALSVSAIVSDAQHGSVTNNGSDITYDPDPDYFGSDSLEYEVSDGNGGLDTAKVNIEISSTNDPIVAVDDESDVWEDSSKTVYVLENDQDADDDTLTIVEISKQPQNGAASVQGDTAIHYVPETDFFGEDSLEYVATDGNGSQDTAKVLLHVKDRNDAPEIVNLPETVSMQVNDSTKLYMMQYAQDVDTPDSLLSWSFGVSDPAISYAYDNESDTLTIYSHGTPGDYMLFTTLTDDSGAFDRDTIDVQVAEPSAIASSGLSGIPKSFEVHQNYPNPFNPTTYLIFGLAKSRSVRIEIYDITGKSMGVIFEGTRAAGYHKIPFDGSRLSSGLYFYRIQADHQHKVKKMMLVK